MIKYDQGSVNVEGGQLSQAKQSLVPLFIHGVTVCLKSQFAVNDR